MKFLNINNLYYHHLIPLTKQVVIVYNMLWGLNHQLNLWLSWSLNMVSDASVTRGHEFPISATLIQSKIFNTTTRYEEGLYCIPTCEGAC